MWKLFGGVIVGGFVGAVAFEILSRRNPGLLKNIEDQAKKTVQAASDAFGDGFHRKEDASRSA